MALKVKGNQIYCYRSVRRGGRVTGVYVGAGPVALLAEAEAVRERDERRAARDAHRRDVGATIAGLEAVSRAVSDLSGRVDASFRRAMIYCGYYQHKRQWRLRSRPMQPGLETYD